MAKYLTDRDRFDGTEFGYTGIGTSSTHIRASFDLYDINRYLNERMAGYPLTRRDEVVRIVRKNLHSRSARSVELLRDEIDRVLKQLGYL